MLLTILLVIIAVVAIALVGVILLQKSDGGALGMGGNGPGAFMTARGTGDLLTTATWWLAGVFFALCLTMTLISGHEHAANSVINQLKLNNNHLDTSNLNRAPMSAQQPAAPAAPAAAAQPPAASFSAAPPQSAPNPLNPFGPAAAPAPAKSSAPPATH